MIDERIPHNAEAEAGLIGAAIVDSSIVDLIDINPGDFYIIRNGWIWDTMQKLSRRGLQPDAVTLMEQLEKDGRLAELGGVAYLGRMIAESVTSFGAQGYASIIKEKAARRQLLAIASKMARAAQDDKADIDPGSFIDDLVTTARPKDGAVHWSNYLSQLWEEVERRSKDPSECWGITTGFPSFDRTTGGLQTGETMIMSGKPGVGKSMLAVQMCAQMAKCAPGAIYSVEMAGVAVMRRILSARTQIEARKLKSGKINSEDWSLICDAIEELEALPVYMSDAAGWTTSALRADLARLKIRHGIQWFMFDYLLLANDLPGHDEIERTAAISRNMKLTARHLDLSGLIIHSMNKAGIDAAVPNVSNLRGSGQVSFDADVIVFLVDYQPMPLDPPMPEIDKPNMRTLIFGKGRELENPKKYIHMVKHPSYPQFGEYVGDKNIRPGMGVADFDEIDRQHMAKVFDTGEN